jgi:hypothetical protein
MIFYIEKGNKKEETVSKLPFNENHPCPNPPSLRVGTSSGWDDFQRLPPFREGQEVDENHERESFETSSSFISNSVTF